MSLTRHHLNCVVTTTMMMATTGGHKVLYIECGSAHHMPRGLPLSPSLNASMCNNILRHRRRRRSSPPMLSTLNRQILGHSIARVSLRIGFPRSVYCVRRVVRKILLDSHMKRIAFPQNVFFKFTGKNNCSRFYSESF